MGQDCPDLKELSQLLLDLAEISLNPMNSERFSFSGANRFIPHITLVGLGIGTANFFLNDNLNWIQWAIQSLSTSFLIGYTTLLVASNKSLFELRIKSKWKLYLFIFSVFLLAGLLATEVEHHIRSLIFKSEPYEPLNGGRMYLFNGVISLVLGFSLFQNNTFFRNKDSNTPENQKDETQEALSPNISANSIPVRQGENILLIRTEDVVYFEAYDNYSFVYDSKGEKRLCDYSLLFLEKRLENQFSRIHRKYIVNERHIKQIRPHLNGRYLIEFSHPGLQPITSSKGYADTIRKLIKIQ